MYVCYVDESGDSGTLQISDINSNPFFVITGLIIEHTRLVPLTHNFLKIKTRFFPNHLMSAAMTLDKIQIEIKGNELRKALRGEDRRRFKQAIGYIDACINLLQANEVKLFGKILIKASGLANNDAAFYGGSIMHICRHFNSFLELKDELGFIVADSRKSSQNRRTTHTIFTQRHQARGNSYPRIVEMPVYGHSNNFSMLQIADIVCSAVIFPMLIDTFGDHMEGSGNVHLSEKYGFVRNRYKAIIREMQFMYPDSQGFMRGGLLVADRTILQRKTGLLFR